jgi:hypothetical protein
MRRSCFTILPSIVRWRRGLAKTMRCLSWLGGRWLCAAAAAHAQELVALAEEKAALPWKAAGMVLLSQRLGYKFSALAISLDPLN